MPATTVESDALARLGKQVRTTGRLILSSVAVRLPTRFRTLHGSNLANEVRSATDFEMAVYTGSSPSLARRWPHSGWILGAVTDLSIITQSASVPPDVIESAADQLVDGVSEAAALLEEMAQAHPGAMDKICTELKQGHGEQTRRMAATILANAFVFQETLAGGPGELASVKSLEELRCDNQIKKSAVLAEWRKILKVNYWPILDIARRIVEVIPPTHTKSVNLYLVTLGALSMSIGTLHDRQITCKRLWGELP
jgi:hypothetical protein